MRSGWSASILLRVPRFARSGRVSWSTWMPSAASPYELLRTIKVGTMSTVSHYPHLTFDADGTARVEGTRYKVIHLAGEHYHYGWSAEEVLRQHPDLRPEEVYSALTYFYDHHDELVSRMNSAASAADQGRLTQPLTRAELLERQSAGNP